MLCMATFLLTALNDHIPYLLPHACVQQLCHFFWWFLSSYLQASMLCWQHFLNNYSEIFVLLEKLFSYAFWQTSSPFFYFTDKLSSFLCPKIDLWEEQNLLLHKPIRTECISGVTQSFPCKSTSRIAIALQCPEGNFLPLVTIVVYCIVTSCLRYRI